jgi:hypothetical protein
MKTGTHTQNIEGWMGGVYPGFGAGLFVNYSGPPMPGVETYLRYWSDDVDGGYVGRQYEGGRAAVRELILPHVIPGVTAYQLTNEFDTNSNQSIANLKLFWVGAMDEADARGIKLLILNWAEGNPHDNNTGDINVTKWKVQQYIPEIKLACARGHFVGVHAYWRPDVEGPRGQYHALGRIVQDVKWWAEGGVPTSQLKLIVNETGIDGGIAGHTAQQGWRYFVSSGQLARAQYLAQVVDAESYANQFTWLKRLFLYDFGAEATWASYNHTEQDARDLLTAIGGVAMPTNSAWVSFLQPSVIQHNPNAALYKAARALGADAYEVSPERDYMGERGQAFRYVSNPGTVHYFACKVGDWGNIRHWTA